MSTDELTIVELSLDDAVAAELLRVKQKVNEIEIELLSQKEKHNKLDIKVNDMEQHGRLHNLRLNDFPQEYRSNEEYRRKEFRRFCRNSLQLSNEFVESGLCCSVVPIEYDHL